MIENDPFLHDDNFLTLDGEIPQKPSCLHRFSKWFLRELWEWTKVFAMAIILYFVVDSIIGRDRVQNISMMPTLKPGDMMLVDKVSYNFAPPAIGDIIVFKYPLDQEVNYVKRVLGLPGDIIEIKNGQLFRNGNLILEPYIHTPMQYSGKWNIPENSFFALGDNRNQSSDSHTWGVVNDQLIIGKVIFVYWPFEHIQAIDALNSGNQSSK